MGIYSWNTGVNQADLSIPVKKEARQISCRDCDRKPATSKPIMVAGVIQPLSLVDPVLPAGFDFAVVDNEGKVLFHSDLTRVLSEKFIVEADGDLELMSAVRGRIARSLKYGTPAGATVRTCSP